MTPAAFTTKHMTLVLVVLFLLVVLIYGLLPGLLGVCLGFMLTKVLTRRVTIYGQEWPALMATVTSLIPLALLGGLIAYASGFAGSVLTQYQGMIELVANTILTIREKLPASMAERLPEEVGALQEMVTQTILTHSKGVALASKAWFHGTLLAYVGIIIGALIAASLHETSQHKLTTELRARAATFSDTFESIVAAQFWIAAFNTVLTAVFLLVALPLFEVQMPYAPALVALTFIAGLIPIVGNLFCNVVLTLVGLAVSPLVAAACLGFLIGIHKFEYFINAKVVGMKTKTVAWEILAVMFIGETIFGVAGLVAAPLFYAYIKREILQDATYGNTY